MKNIISIALILSFSQALYSTHLEKTPILTTYEICYDIDMSPYAGSENLLFGTKIIEFGSSSLMKLAKLSDSQSFLARTSRAVELIALYLPLNWFTSVVQHEVFGHGYRIRDIGDSIIYVSGYQFDYPPPYGDGNGATFFKFSSSRITTTDLSSVSIAGIEAQNILAMETKLKWLQASRIDPRQSILYLFNQYGLNLYASDEGFEDEDIEGNDLRDYVQTLNLTYTNNFLTTKKIRSLSLINLLDPFTYYSAYSWVYYLFTGKDTAIPMIPIKDYRYLLGARIGLTPFGLEYFIDNYLLKKENPIYFYLKGGNHAENTYLGAGCFVPHLYASNHWALGFRLDAWRQPKLLLQNGNRPLTQVNFKEPFPIENPLYSQSEQHELQYGCAASLIYSYTVNRFFGLQAELGAKTKGFLPGYSIYSSPVARFSYLARF